MTLLELLPFVLVAVAFWLLILRPAKVRRNEAAALLARLAPGQRVMTTAGVFGTLVAVDDDQVRLEVAPGVVIELVPQAIGRIVEQAAVPDDPPNGADADPAMLAEPEASASPNPEADRG